MALAETPAIDLRDVEEVIVTAQKRAERLQDVPAAVTAIRADRLVQNGMLKITDYQALAPSLSVNDVTAGGGQNSISIRGITTGPNGRPTVGIFVDDVPVGRATAAGSIPDIDPADLERIEVLRGPQGTLYGGGSIGGLVKYVTRSPDFNRFSGRVEVGGTSVASGDSGWSARGSFNAPLSDNVAIRASAFKREDAGYIDNLATSEDDTNTRKYDGGRLSVGFRLGNDFNVRVSAASQRIRAEANPIIDLSRATGQPVYGDLQTRRAPGSDNSDDRDDVYDIRITGDIGWAELVSSTSYEDRDYSSNFDYSPVLSALIAQRFGVSNAGAAVFTTRDTERTSQELRLSSKGASALSWQVGGFYTYEKSEGGQDVTPFDLLTGGALPSPIPMLGSTRSPTTFKELAGFGNITYSFTSRFDVTVGARYSENEQSGNQSTAGVLFGTTFLPLQSDDDSVTYLLNPRFKISENAMIYGRVASGYRPGGPNLPAPGVPLGFEHDEVLNYEMGFKAELADRAVSLDAAVFYIDWQDIQVSRSSSIGTVFYVNAGEAHSQGIEATLNWRPLSRLAFAGNVAYTEAELDSALPSGVARAGDRLPDTPRWAGYLSTDYSFPAVGNWSGAIGASWRYVGERIAALVATPYRLPSYDTFDLRLGLTNDRYSINLYGANLSDERGYVSAFRFGTVEQIALIQPRTVGVSVSAAF